MRIDLRQIETLVISLPGDARRAAAASLCEGLGLNFRFVDAVRCTPGSIGCGLSHIRALRGSGRPALVLEDDVAASTAFKAVLDIPDDADAVYVGTSAYGGVEPLNWIGVWNMVAAEPCGTPGLVRVHNMLSTHAILYLTEAFKRAADDAIVDVIAARGWEPDLGFAMIQRRFNVYALTRPAFYQAAPLQSSPERGHHQQTATLAQIPLYELGQVLNLVMEGGTRPIELVREAGALTWRFI